MMRLLLSTPVEHTTASRLGRLFVYLQLCMYAFVLAHYSKEISDGRVTTC